MSTAKRVAYELNRSLGREVGFQVRHDRKIGDNSAIKFMTDGILLREVQVLYHLGLDMVDCTSSSLKRRIIQNFERVRRQTFC